MFKPQIFTCYEWTCYVMNLFVECVHWTRRPFAFLKQSGSCLLSDNEWSQMTMFPKHNSTLFHISSPCCITLMCCHFLCHFSHFQARIKSILYKPTILWDAGLARCHLGLSLPLRFITLFHSICQNNAISSPSDSNPLWSAFTGVPQNTANLIVNMKVYGSLIYIQSRVPYFCTKFPAWCCNYSELSDMSWFHLLPLSWGGFLHLTPPTFLPPLTEFTSPQYPQSLTVWNTSYHAMQTTTPIPFLSLYLN